MLSPYRGRGFYDPFSEVNRLFDEAFGGLARRSGARAQAAQQVTAEWTPAIDVVQQDDDLVVRAELPGASPEDVQITYQNGVLTLSGRVQEEREEQWGGYLVRERRSGSFRRSLQLPEGVDEDSIRARFENRVLEVTLQGAAAAREPRRIQVEAGQGSAGARTSRSPAARGARAARAPPTSSRAPAARRPPAGRAPPRGDRATRRPGGRGTRGPDLKVTHSANADDHPSPRGRARREDPKEKEDTKNGDDEDVRRMRGEARGHDGQARSRRGTPEDGAPLRGARRGGRGRRGPLALGGGSLFD